MTPGSVTALIRTSWLMAVLAAGFCIALLLDPRVIDGAPAWLKPFKFAASLSIYGFTFAWILRHLTAWPRLRAVAAWITTGMALLEIGLIGMQAGRGVASHFNLATPFDAAVYAAMGVAIGTQTLTAGVVAVALWWQPFSDRTMGLAIRLGLAITVVGAATGSIMTRTSASQRATAGPLMRLGAHSVGGEDGGTGLAAVKWSTEHGDLRVAHFIGLHAMQAIPLVALLIRRRLPERPQRIVIAGAAASYAVLFIFLLAQALAGQPLTAPGGWIAQALALWAVCSAGLALYALHAARRRNASDVPLNAPPS